MPYYRSVGEIPPDEEAYSCNCVDGHCSNCGQCCSDLLPLNPGELETIKRYAAKHNLTEHRQAPFWDPGATDLTCPFRNQQTRKCDIYPVRPLICRSFICSKPLAVAHHDRDAIYESRNTHSLRYEVFGNTECIDLIAKACMKAAGLL